MRHPFLALAMFMIGLGLPGRTYAAIATKILPRTQAGLLVTGVCNEQTNPSRIAVALATTFKDPELSKNRLELDFKAHAVITGPLAVVESLRVFVAQRFRPKDGSYHGMGPEVVCVQLAEPDAATACTKLQSVVESGKLGFRYIGCLSKASSFQFTQVDLERFFQQHSPHDSQSPYATAIIRFRVNHYDEAKQAVEQLGYSIASRSNLEHGRFHVRTGFDSKKQFQQFCEKLSKATAILSCNSNRSFETKTTSAAVNPH